MIVLHCFVEFDKTQLVDFFRFGLAIDYGGVKCAVCKTRAQCTRDGVDVS